MCVALSSVKAFGSEGSPNFLIQKCYRVYPVCTEMTKALPQLALGDQHARDVRISTNSHDYALDDILITVNYHPTVFSNGRAGAPHPENLIRQEFLDPNGLSITIVTQVQPSDSLQCPE